MPFLLQMARLLSTWPGDLVYHLVVLFAVEAMVGLAGSLKDAPAQGPAGRFEPRLARRVWRVALALAFGRVLLVLAAFLTRQANLPSAAVLPLLERCVDVAGLGLLAWAFVPLWGRSRRVGYALYLANPIAAFAACLLLAPGWYTSAGQGMAFNGSLQDLAWSVWGLALAGLAAAGVLVGRREQAEWRGVWGHTLVAFAFVGVGYLLHLLFYDPDLSVSGWVRLAFFAAFPLLVIFLYQQVVRSSGAGPALAEASGPWPAWEALWRVAESAGAEQAGALHQVAAALAAAVKAPVVAVEIPSDSPDVVEQVALYRRGVSPAQGSVFPLDAQPVIKRAITLKQGLPVDARDAGAVALAALLGDSNLSGALWVEPIVHARQAMGVLVAGKESGSVGWTPADLQTVHAYAVHLGRALNTARSLQEAARRNEDAARRLADLESQLAQSKASAQALLDATRSELRQCQAELNAARQQAAQYRQRVDDLAALVQFQDGLIQRNQHGPGSPEKAHPSDQE